MSIFYKEKFLDERIDQAKALALSVKTAVDVDTVEKAEMVLRMVISQYYKIPFFSEYFDHRTIDEMFFEAELIALHSRPALDSSSRVIKDHKKQTDALADEMEKELDKEWQSMESELPPDDGTDPFAQMAKTFMETGNFAGENDNVPQPEQQDITPQQEEGEPDDWK